MRSPGETADLEAVATLLWASTCRGEGDGTATGWETAMVDLAHLAAAIHRAWRGRMPLRAMLPGLPLRCSGAGRGPLHLRLAAHWRVPAAADLLRRALVLLADHELNASTFAARVTVSTGASLAAGTLAGLAALGGPRHAAPQPASALAEDIGTLGDDATHALRDWLGEGRSVPGFGHRLYPRGDPRARALWPLSRYPPLTLRLHRAVGSGGRSPQCRLCARRLRVNLHPAAMQRRPLFALARSVGWLAHMIEQVTSGNLIRPRAHYVGLTAKSSERPRQS